MAAPFMRGATRRVGEGDDARVISLRHPNPHSKPINRPSEYKNHKKENFLLEPMGYDRHIVILDDGEEEYPCAIHYNPLCTITFSGRFAMLRHIKEARAHRGQVFADNGDGWLVVVGNLPQMPGKLEFDVDLQRRLDPPPQSHVGRIPGHDCPTEATIAAAVPSNSSSTDHAHQVKEEDGDKEVSPAYSNKPKNPRKSKIEYQRRELETKIMEPVDYERHIICHGDGTEVYSCAVRYPRPCGSIVMRRHSACVHLTQNKEHEGHAFADRGDGWLAIVSTLAPIPEKFDIEWQRVVEPPSEFHMLLLQGQVSASQGTTAIPCDGSRNTFAAHPFLMQEGDSDKEVPSAHLQPLAFAPPASIKSMPRTFESSRHRQEPPQALNNANSHLPHDKLSDLLKSQPHGSNPRSRSASNNFERPFIKDVSTLSGNTIVGGANKLAGYDEDYDHWAKSGIASGMFIPIPAEQAPAQASSFVTAAMHASMGMGISRLPKTPVIFYPPSPRVPQCQSPYTDTPEMSQGGQSYGLSYPPTPRAPHPPNVSPYINTPRTPAGGQPYGACQAAWVSNSYPEPGYQVPSYHNGRIPRREALSLGPLRLVRGPAPSFQRKFHDLTNSGDGANNKLPLDVFAAEFNEHHRHAVENTMASYYAFIPHIKGPALASATGQVPSALKVVQRYMDCGGEGEGSPDSLDHVPLDDGEIITTLTPAFRLAIVQVSPMPQGSENHKNRAGSVSRSGDGHPRKDKGVSTKNQSSSTSSAFKSKAPPAKPATRSAEEEEEEDEDEDKKPFKGPGVTTINNAPALPGVLYTRITLYYTNSLTGQKIVETVLGVLDPRASITTISLPLCQQRNISLSQFRSVEIFDADAPAKSLTHGVDLDCDVHDSFGRFTTERVRFYADAMMRNDVGNLVVVLGYDWTMGKTIERDPRKMVWRFSEGDVLDARRGSRIRLFDPRVLGQHTAAYAPTLAMTPSHRHEQPESPIPEVKPKVKLTSMQKARLGKPCTNCDKVGIRTHYKGPTGYTVCCSCNDKWRKAGFPAAWGSMKVADTASTVPPGNFYTPTGAAAPAAPALASIARVAQATFAPPPSSAATRPSAVSSSDVDDDEVPIVQSTKKSKKVARPEPQRGKEDSAEAQLHTEAAASQSSALSSPYATIEDPDRTLSAHADSDVEMPDAGPMKRGNEDSDTSTLSELSESRFKEKGDEEE